MPRIQGIDVPNDKPVRIALTYIFGIGHIRAAIVCKEVGIDPMLRARNLSEDEVARISSYIGNNFRVEGELRREVAANVKRLKDIGCYRGIRHRKGLPVRGQATQSNARTRKGPRKTVAGKKSIKSMH